MPQSFKGHEVVTVAEAAKILGVSKHSVRKRIASGRLAGALIDSGPVGGGGSGGVLLVLHKSVLAERERIDREVDAAAKVFEGWGVPDGS